MITIYDSATMACTLSNPLDPDLRAILDGRLALLYPEFADWDLRDLAHFIVVEPGDSIEAIERELGINPLVNIVDNVRYPDPAFDPSFEFCIARKGYFDLTFCLSDAGLAHCLLVPDQDGIDPTLLELCRLYAAT